MSASFTDGNEKYTLTFQIHRGLPPQMACHFAPTLERYVGVEVTSPITGIGRTEWSKELLPASWAEARRLLESIKPQVAVICEDSSIFDAMVRIADNKGVPPNR